MLCFQNRRCRDFPLCRINYAYICTWMHANAREQKRSGVRVQTTSGTGERDTPHGRVKPKCLARKYRSCQRFAPCKTDFEKSTTVLQSKSCIDTIHWFVRDLIPSSFHWNVTVECGKVYELFTAAYLPSLAWGWVSTTLREWGTVKPNV